jgi:hypothetical protein
MKKSLLTLLIISFGVTISLSAANYSFRRFPHVKAFYKDIVYQAIEVSKENKLPAAAMLAISGLESGYGSGYVSQITGNILSLGAFKSDKELPALYLPYSLSKKTVLFDPKEIKNSSSDDLVYKKRPKSLKRDYREAPHAGTNKHLELLKYNKILREKARYLCLKDFATRWIVVDSNIKVFRQTRVWLDNLIKKNGDKILYSMSVNSEFIDRIGGVPHSFNYRKTWNKKVKLIMKRVGLVELVDDIVNKNKTFEEAWSTK